MRTIIPALLLGLVACTTSTPGARSERLAPSFTGMLPVAPASDNDRNAPADTTMPLGAGFTIGPSTAMLAAGLDFPIDNNLTFGPSFQYGFDDDTSLVSLTGQLKYFLPSGSKESGWSWLRPYLTAGVGLAYLDRDGRGSDTGMVWNGGAGLRYLTGEHYRVGSEVRFNVLPDKLAGERGYVSVELLQVIVTF